jgi:hypothetical protein
MQTKVVLKSISPVGAPVRPEAGAQGGPPQHSAYAATFVAGDFPADGVVPPDFVHLTSLVPFTVIVNAETGKGLKIGGEYVMSLNPA